MLVKTNKQHLEAFMTNKGIVLCLAAAILTGAALFAQTGEGIADKLSFEFEFNASILSADSEGVVDSMTDSGFNEDGTKIGLGYEDELWGASAALLFGNENLRFLNGEIGEMFGGFPLALDELYGWVKPFGGWFKFTAGVFENTDGIADYTDDIDDFSMGVFLLGQGGEAFLEPEETTKPSLVNGLLSEAAFGPLTLQFLLAPNYSKEGAAVLGNGLLEPMYGMAGMAFTPIDANARFLRYGARVIVDAGVGTVSALYKVFQWPINIVNGMMIVNGMATYPGSNMTYNTFGAYFDLTAVENLGVSLGYTGFLTFNDASDIDNVLYSGIDLRATWTGIEGLSLSTHHNISFAQGAEKDWLGALGKDDSFFNLYNAIGATMELSEMFSVGAQIGNVFSKTDLGATETTTDTLWVEPKCIISIGEHAEFNAGLRLDLKMDTETGEDDENQTTFSIPIGIVISF
jgi:hypothetical protein